MRILVLLVLLGVIAGCSHGPNRTPRESVVGKAPAGKPGSTSSPSLIVTPENGLMGKVVAVRSEQRFMVVNFPVGRLPAAGQRMGLYRRGLKVGEVKIGDQRRDDNIVADLVTGNAAVGDEVRE